MRAAFIAALLALPGVTNAAPPQWTWEAGKQSNNGAITLKSVNGATTYNGTQNPTGAVAKTNQNAVTQPPTVVIQSTGNSGYAEIIPYISVGTTSLPTCPIGYSILWSGESSVHGMSPKIFNAGGSRFNLTGFFLPSNGYTYYGWNVDGEINKPSYATTGVLEIGTTFWGSYGFPTSWSAVLCTK